MSSRRRDPVEREPYSIVLRRIWGDEKFQALSKNAKLMFLYFLTGPDCTVIPGLLTKMGLGTLCDRLDDKYPAVSKAWKEIELQGMASADWKAGVIWLPKGIIHNPPANQFVVVNWRTVPLPECDLVRRALAEMRARLACRPSQELAAAFDRIFQQQFPEIVGGKGDGVQDRVGDGLRDGVEEGQRLDLEYEADGVEDGVADRQADQEQEQEQDQEQDRKRLPQPPLARGRAITRREREDAEDIIDNHGCPHEGITDGESVSAECATRAECIGRIVAENRANEARGLAGASR